MARYPRRGRSPPLAPVVVKTVVRPWLAQNSNIIYDAAYIRMMVGAETRFRRGFRCTHNWLPIVNIVSYLRCRRVKRVHTHDPVARMLRDGRSIRWDSRTGEGAARLFCIAGPHTDCFQRRGSGLATSGDCVCAL